MRSPFQNVKHLVGDCAFAILTLILHRDFEVDRPSPKYSGYSNSNPTCPPIAILRRKSYNRKKFTSKETCLMQHPILQDFPHEFYTESLLIRLPLPGDGRALYQAIQTSRLDLKKWLPFAQGEQTFEETEINVRKAHSEFLKRTDLRLHIFHRETGQFIGSTGLHRIDWEVPKFEIGYWIDSRESGKGYMTEAVKGVTNFAFQKLKANRVEIRCDAKNHKSRVIPERLGFTLEGIHYHDSIAIDSNELRDTCIYAIVKAAI